MQPLAAGLVALPQNAILALAATLLLALAVGLAVIVAGVWGGLAGWFKARFGVNEVISTIMLNWTALYISNWAITIESFGRQGTGKTYAIQPTAHIDILGQWKRTPEGIAFLREHPMLWDILKSPINLGFIFQMFYFVITASAFRFVFIVGFPSVVFVKEECFYKGLNGF